jgi:phage regulator Rha-like protein
MFQLTKEEADCLRFQIETLENSNPLRSQFVTLDTGRGKHSKYLPYAFTEQGVGMLSGVLSSNKAVEMHIAIVRAFVETRKLLLQQTDPKAELKEIKERLGEHDTQLNSIYDAWKTCWMRKLPKENGQTGTGSGS